MAVVAAVLSDFISAPSLEARSQPVHRRSHLGVVPLFIELPHGRICARCALQFLGDRHDRRLGFEHFLQPLVFRARPWSPSRSKSNH
jgi:hypothetical protein